jgi:hypothetical protein
MTERDHSKFFRQQRTLLETFLQEFRILLPEVTQNPEVGAVQVADIHETEVFVTTSLDLPRAEYATTVSIYQDTNDQPWTICSLSNETVILLDTGNVNPLKYVIIDKALVILRQQIEYVRRKEKPLIEILRIVLEPDIHTDFLSIGGQYDSIDIKCICQNIFNWRLYISCQ